MKLYRIKDWAKHYEVSDSKKVSGPLQWVPVRTKTDGFGYARITLEKDKTDLLAAWYLMLGIAAKQPREERGKLARDGVPLSPEDMEMLTRFPAKVFERALVFFSDARQGWLVSEDIRNDSDASGRNRDLSEPSGSTVHTVHTEQDTTGHAPGGGAAVTEKDKDQLRAESLMRRRPTTPWSAAELRAWKTAKAVVADTDEASWELLGWWYGLPAANAPYRKTDFAALLNNWHAEIEKARRNRGDTQPGGRDYARELLG